MESELGLKNEEGDACLLDRKKEQKHCLLKEKHTIKSKAGGCLHGGGRGKDVNTLLNVVLCLLCGISVSFSGYFSYREIRLETRVTQLELELSRKMSQVGSVVSGGSDVVIERLRREVEQRYRRRLGRDLMAGRRLLMAEEADSLQDTLNPHGRRTREASDCICRPETVILTGEVGNNRVDFLAMCNVGLSK
ncbi:hypothetical protein RUM43_003776 [Polyplax serrata]|uniref:Uncharacterized protein n=1 Tax=Polyplax serrata TaxID=468196 RepID=A0AAN8NXC9_POLSC